MTTQSDIELVRDFLDLSVQVSSDEDLLQMKAIFTAFTRIIANTLPLDEIPEGWNLHKIIWSGNREYPNCWDCYLLSPSNRQSSYSGYKTPLEAFRAAIEKAKEMI